MLARLLAFSASGRLGCEPSRVSKSFTWTTHDIRLNSQYSVTRHSQNYHMYAPIYPHIHIAHKCFSKSSRFFLKRGNLYTHKYVYKTGADSITSRTRLKFRIVMVATTLLFASFFGHRSNKARLDLYSH